MTEEEKFNFSHDIQKKIVAMMFFDGKFLESYEGQIKPKYFDNPVLKDLSKMAIDFYEKYSRIPNTDEFWEEVDILITERKKRQKDLPIEEYTNMAAEVVTIGTKANFDYVRDKALAFAKHQAMKQALLNAGEKLDKGEYYDIAKLVNEASIAGDRDEPIGLKTIDCSEVEPEDVVWLWRDRIPLGKLTFIIGDPGVGKSFLTASFCKHITTGEQWPDVPAGEVEKGSVILLNAEDGLADTIVRRLEWAGVDRSKVTYIEATIERKGEERTFRLDKDLSKLENLLKTKEDVRLIILDPLSAYLGDIDSYRDAEVRRMLGPVALLAQKYKVAILAVLHLNKTQSVNAIYRVPGSIGFAGAARAIWYISEDEETEGRRLFSGMKTNLSRKDMRDLGLAFRIDNKVIWEDVPMRKTTKEILREQEGGVKKPLDSAMDWLKDVLKNGPVGADEIKEMVEDEDFGLSTVKKAKKRLNVESDRKGGYGKGSKSYWLLPSAKERIDLKKGQDDKQEKEPEKKVEAKPKKELSPAEMVERIKRKNLKERE